LWYKFSWERAKLPDGFIPYPDQQSCPELLVSGNKPYGLNLTISFPVKGMTISTNEKACAIAYDGRLSKWIIIVPNSVDANTMIGMGNTAENMAERWKISKEEQDVWAWKSNMRAAAAYREGKFKHEIVPMEGVFPDGTTKIVDYDESVRPDSKLEKIRTLPAIYKVGGTVDAANSSKEADGAAASVFMSKDKARELGLVPMCTVRAIAWEACDPKIMGDEKDGVSMYGGFAGTETNRSQRNPTQNVTTISAASSGYAVSMKGVLDPLTTLDGF
jgi:hypothetical protein